MPSIIRKGWTTRIAFILLLVLLWLVYLSCSRAFCVQGISFLCMNDFHAAVEPLSAGWLERAGTAGGAVCVAAHVERFRKDHPNTLWVVTGDVFMGHYLDSLTQGKAMIEFLNLIPPDCYVLGNHEFDYGLDVLAERIRDARFPIVCANIRKGEGGTLVKPFIIHEMEGIRVLVIGVICRNLAEIVLPGRLGDLEVTDPVQSILQCTDSLDSTIDLTVVLSHSGLSADRRIAAALPPSSGVDIIIGGHSHDLMEKTETVNGIIICQAGSKGRYLGHLAVDMEPGKGLITAHSWDLIPTLCEGMSHPKVAQWLEGRLQGTAGGMEEVIGTLEGEWTREAEAIEWPIADFATDAIAEQTGAEIGIYNRGGIRKGLSGPYIRIKDVWEMFPFGNHLVQFCLTGRQVKILLERHLSFAGEHLFFSGGLRYTFNPKRPSGARCISATVNGKPLDPDRLYTIATVEFLWGHSGSAFGLRQAAIKENGGFREYPGLIERDIIINRIKRLKHIRPQTDGRVKVVTDPLTFLFFDGVPFQSPEFLAPFPARSDSSSQSLATPPVIPLPARYPG
ncbi:MAG: bifunctional metallophosphatase/5'-nucleotidase [bacterium]